MSACLDWLLTAAVAAPQSPSIDHLMDKREDPQAFPEVLQATAETCWLPENECSLWLLPLLEVDV